ncbi:hypothetical protein RFI_08950 [Reticulomyxa filosa]|uniref:DYW domain-containing protein n=1 Tax=Reticulomyxa filosa TaxID=46433 RepID=X6NS62_RETFI|nr:hypothetical protein RFI_08950 [Reticulomyxa filosa]|eukprot:ETO28182.1 hypothetical protein RFI_08950 [Reticulomyxa filosa]
MFRVALHSTGHPRPLFCVFGSVRRINVRKGVSYSNKLPTSIETREEVLMKHMSNNELDKAERFVKAYNDKIWSKGNAKREQNGMELLDKIYNQSQTSEMRRKALELFWNIYKSEYGPKDQKKTNNTNPNTNVNANANANTNTNAKEGKKKASRMAMQMCCKQLQANENDPLSNKICTILLSDPTFVEMLARDENLKKQLADTLLRVPYKKDGIWDTFVDKWPLFHTASLNAEYVERLFKGLIWEMENQKSITPWNMFGSMFFDKAIGNHAHMQGAIFADKRLTSLLLRFFAQCKDWDRFGNVFLHMCKRNGLNVVWMTKLYLKWHEGMLNTREIATEAKVSDTQVWPSALSDIANRYWPTVIKACQTTAQLDKVHSLLFVRLKGQHISLRVCMQLIRKYGELNERDKMESLWSHVQSDVRLTDPIIKRIVWSAWYCILIHLHTKSRDFTDAFRIIEEAKQMYAAAAVMLDTHLVTAIMYTYAKCGNHSKVVQLFDHHFGDLEKDAAASVATAHARPKIATFVTVFHACAQLCNLARAKRYYRMCRRQWRRANQWTQQCWSAALHMFCACRDVHLAYRLFRNCGAKKSNTMVYITMIRELARYGHIKQAMKLFGEVPGKYKTLGMYEAFLRQCSLHGQWDVCVRIWEMGWCQSPEIEGMDQLLNIVIRCLARQNQLELAWSYARKYGIYTRTKFHLAHPINEELALCEDIAVHCYMHRNLRVYKKMHFHLTRMPGWNVSARWCWRLNTLYADMRQWNEVNCVWEDMCSRLPLHEAEVACVNQYIFQNNKLLSWDTQPHGHIPTKIALVKVQDQLNDLYDKIRVQHITVGNNTYTKTNVNKRNCKHNERYGVVHQLQQTSPNTQLIVHKNKHMCDDCHIFMKKLSLLCNRTITVLVCLENDKMQHCFQKGHCSCETFE